MRKIRFLALALAIISVILCFSSCKLGKGIKKDTAETTAVDDGKANHMTVNLRVYTMVDTKNLTKLAEREIIIGAYNLSIGYDDGETVTANMILQTLADARNATVEFSTSGSVDKISFDGVTYQSGRKINLDRKGQEENSNKDLFDVYYYDVMVWEWRINNEIVEKMSEVTINEGDQLILTLIYDDTSKAGYELAETIETEGVTE